MNSTREIERLIKNKYEILFNLFKLLNNIYFKIT